MNDAPNMRRPLDDTDETSGCDHDARVYSLFQQLREKPPGEQSRVIEAKLTDDRAVALEVRELLGLADRATSVELLEQPLSTDELGELTSVGDRKRYLPKRIRSYEILGEFEGGGMSVVYLARQAKPNRTAVLKMVPSWKATPDIVRRFELEAEVLGRLDHPAIARIYEAGAVETESGPRAFFAMEHIEGRPLLEHVRVHALTDRDRLNLFAQICDGVAHAHQRGVIHRDLKPANILVASDGQPKILDFGVARLMRPDGLNATLETHAGVIIGTPRYMSPEQASRNPADVTLRSDVYTLGVILFEMLSGELPYPVADKSLVETLEIVRDRAAKPLGQLRPSLRGDVEAITAKALEKDPSQRYQSAGALADDIRRHLRGEAVEARGSKAVYQLGRFVARNKGMAVATTIALAAIVAGAVISTIMWQRASREAAQNAGSTALLRAIANNPTIKRASDGELKLPEFLGTFAAAVHRTAETHSTLGGEGYEFIARSFEDLNDYVSSLIYRELAHERYALVLGPEHEKTLEAMRHWAFAVSDNIGKPRPPGGRSDEELGQLACSIMAEHNRLIAQAHGRDSDKYIIHRDSEATVLADAGRIDEALAILDEITTHAENKTGASRNASASALSHRGYVLNVAGRFPEAVQVYRRALPLLAEAYGNKSHEYAAANLNFTNISLPNAGLDDEALPRMEAMWGPIIAGNEVPTPDQLSRIRVLATLYGKLGRWEDAEKLNRRILELSEAHFGKLDNDALKSLNNLAAVLCQRRSIEEALAATTELVSRLEQLPDTPPEHALTFRRRHGTALRLNGRFDEAERILLDVERFHREGGYELIDRTFDALADLYENMNKPEVAAIWRRRAEVARANPRGPNK